MNGVAFAAWKMASSFLVGFLFRSNASQIEFWFDRKSHTMYAITAFVYSNWFLLRLLGYSLAIKLTWHRPFINGRCWKWISCKVDVFPRILIPKLKNVIQYIFSHTIRVRLQMPTNLDYADFIVLPNGHTVILTVVQKMLIEKLSWRRKKNEMMRIKKKVHMRISLMMELRSDFNIVRWIAHNDWHVANDVYLMSEFVQVA